MGRKKHFEIRHFLFSQGKNRKGENFRRTHGLCMAGLRESFRKINF